MGSVNRVFLVGNLGRDAELRYTAGGAAVATFSIATTEKWNNKSGQPQEKTEWHRIVLWGKSAEALTAYLQKGKSVAVEGRLETRKWADKDGNEKSTTEIKADRVALLGGGHGPGATPDRPAKTASPAKAAKGQPVPAADVDDLGYGADDDIPFAWILPFVLPLVGAAAALLAGGVRV